MKIYKRKIFSLLKRPNLFALIFYCNDVRVGGLGFTFIFENLIIKVRDKNRIKEKKYQFNKYKIWTLKDIKYEKKKFQTLNKKKATIIKNRLYLEKIDGKSLIYYINTDEFWNLLNKSIEKLKKIDYHGDFHLDNILVGQNCEIYFIDFEYSYHSRLKGYEKEIDILLLLYELKKQFPKFFKVSVIKLKGLIFRHFEKNNLLKAKELIKNYLKDEIDEIFE